MGVAVTTHTYVCAGITYEAMFRGGGEFIRYKVSPKAQGCPKHTGITYICTKGSA